jgi:hypothetical protein
MSSYGWRLPSASIKTARVSISVGGFVTGLHSSATVSSVPSSNCTAAQFHA